MFSWEKKKQQLAITYGQFNKNKQLTRIEGLIDIAGCDIMWNIMKYLHRIHFSVWELMHKHYVLYCSRHHCSTEIFPVRFLYCFFLTQLRPFTRSFITGRLQSCSFTGLIGPWLEKMEPICTPSNHYLSNMSFSELSLFLFTHSGVGGPAPCYLWWCPILEMWQVEWDSLQGTFLPHAHFLTSWSCDEIIDLH